MKGPLYLLMSAVCGLVLTGCGQKGALYLPDQPRNAAVSPAATPATATPAASPATAEPAAATPAATPDAAAPATAPAADNATTGAASPVPADSDPPPRRSNTAPRTN